MKKPILTLEDRLDIKHDTHRGAQLKVTIAWLNFKRELDKEIRPIFQPIIDKLSLIIKNTKQL